MDVLQAVKSAIEENGMQLVDGVNLGDCLQEPVCLDTLDDIVIQMKLTASQQLLSLQLPIMLFASRDVVERWFSS